jgi:hypothetical protein
MGWDESRGGIGGGGGCLMAVRGGVWGGKKRKRKRKEKSFFSLSLVFSWSPAGVAFSPPCQKNTSVGDRAFFLPMAQNRKDQTLTDWLGDDWLLLGMLR